MNNNNSTNHRVDATSGGSLRERLANVSLSARSLSQSVSTISTGSAEFLRTIGRPLIQLFPDLSPSRHVPLRTFGTPSRGESEPVQAAAPVAPVVQVAGPDTSLETFEAVGAKKSSGLTTGATFHPRTEDNIAAAPFGDDATLHGKVTPTSSLSKKSIGKHVPAAGLPLQVPPIEPTGGVPLSYGASFSVTPIREPSDASCCPSTGDMHESDISPILRRPDAFEEYIPSSADTLVGKSVALKSTPNFKSPKTYAKRDLTDTMNVDDPTELISADANALQTLLQLNDSLSQVNAALLARLNSLEEARDDRDAAAVHQRVREDPVGSSVVEDVSPMGDRGVDSDCPASSTLRSVVSPSHQTRGKSTAGRKTPASTVFGFNHTPQVQPFPPDLVGGAYHGYNDDELVVQGSYEPTLLQNVDLVTLQEEPTELVTSEMVSVNTTSQLLLDIAGLGVEFDGGASLASETTLDGATALGNANPTSSAIVGNAVSYVVKPFDPGVCGLPLPFDPGEFVGVMLLACIMGLLFWIPLDSLVNYIHLGLLLWIDASLCTRLIEFILHPTSFPDHFVLPRLDSGGGDRDPMLLDTLIFRSDRQQTKLDVVIRKEPTVLSDLDLESVSLVRKEVPVLSEKLDALVEFESAYLDKRLNAAVRVMRFGAVGSACSLDSMAALPEPFKRVADVEQLVPYMELPIGGDYPFGGDFSDLVPSAVDFVRADDAAAILSVGCDTADDCVELTLPSTVPPDYTCNALASTALLEDCLTHLSTVSLDDELNAHTSVLLDDGLDEHSSTVLFGNSLDSRPSVVLLYEFRSDSRCFHQKETMSNQCLLTQFFAVLCYTTLWLISCFDSRLYSQRAELCWISQIIFDFRRHLMCARDLHRSWDFFHPLPSSYRWRRRLDMSVFNLWLGLGHSPSESVFVKGIPMLDLSSSLIWTSALVAFGTSTSCRSSISMVQLLSVAICRWRRRVSMSVNCCLTQQYLSSHLDYSGLTSELPSTDTIDRELTSIDRALTSSDGHLSDVTSLIGKSSFESSLGFTSVGNYSLDIVDQPSLDSTPHTHSSETVADVVELLVDEDVSLDSGDVCDISTKLSFHPTSSWIAFSLDTLGLTALLASLVFSVREGGLTLLEPISGSKYLWDLFIKGLGRIASSSCDHGFLWICDLLSTFLAEHCQLEKMIFNFDNNNRRSFWGPLATVICSVSSLSLELLLLRITSSVDYRSCGGGYYRMPWSLFSLFGLLFGFGRWTYRRREPPIGIASRQFLYDWIAMLATVLDSFVSLFSPLSLHRDKGVVRKRDSSSSWNFPTFASEGASDDTVASLFDQKELGPSSNQKEHSLLKERISILSATVLEFASAYYLGHLCRPFSFSFGFLV